MQTYQLLGVKFQALTMTEALDLMESYLQEERPHLVVTVGPEMIMRAQEDEAFKRLINGADLVVPDGTGVLWAAARCGIEVPERIAGVELIEKFAARLAERGSEGLYLLGSAPGVAEKAGEKLQALYPGLRIAGVHDGYFKEEEPIVAAIRESGARVLYVALGAGKQESFVERQGERAGIRVGVGVGGSFDVISGLKKRAPQIFIKLHLEWLYRALGEPSRWRRLLAIPRFMALVWSKGKGAVSLWRPEENMVEANTD